ncbi:MAG: hypothetical protein HY211_08490 [Candidatus Omnitrophica bacterium]|nr:hypothetical protein [Candidatus Omnitrophota bacterium]
MRFNRWVARVFEELPPNAHQAVLSWFRSFEKQIDQAYRDSDWATFQSALTHARARISDIQERQPSEGFPGRHWIYHGWSWVLDGEAWFVCCDQEMAQLVRKGIPRGAIYTEAELTELLNLPHPSYETLKSVHLVKIYFDGTVLPEEPLKTQGKPQ